MSTSGSGVLKGWRAEAGGAAGGRKCLNNRPMFYFRLLGAKSNVIKRTKIKDLGKKAIVLEIEVFVKNKNSLLITMFYFFFLLSPTFSIFIKCTLVNSVPYIRSVAFFKNRTFMARSCGLPSKSDK